MNLFLRYLADKQSAHRHTDRHTPMTTRPCGLRRAGKDKRLLHPLEHVQGRLKNVRFCFVNGDVSLLVQVDFISRNAQCDVITKHLPQLLHPDFHLDCFTKHNCFVTSAYTHSYTYTLSLSSQAAVDTRPQADASLLGFATVQ